MDLRAPSTTPRNVEGRLNHPDGGSVVLRRVSDLATAQRGVVAHGQLLEVGATARQVDRWLLTGWLCPRHEGVYAVGHAAPVVGAAFHAAVLAAGDGAALSHRSAACHLCLISWAPARVDVIVPRSGQRARSGIRFHRPKVYGPEDRFIADGIPCTTVARTLVDLAAVLKHHQLERAIEQAELLRVLDVDAIAEVLGRIARPRGVRNLRRCLGDERLDAGLTQSANERRFLRLCIRAGLPRPALQHPVEIAPGLWHKVDFAWPEARLAIEIDGGAVHTTRTAARRDRRLDRQIRDAGWRVERFMDVDVSDTPDEVHAALRSLLHDIEGRLDHRPGG
jgi:hypothetical protein